MQSTQDFSGLGMPVFTAFGWAGEETAIQYALSQLEAFVQALHAALPVSVQSELPVHGLDKDTQSVYLSSDSNVEDNIHIAFFARPSSLELQLALTNKELLTKGYKQISKDPALFYRFLQRLEPQWNLRLQQVHINEESGEEGHYTDLFKDSLGELNEASAVELLEKAAYLNSEDKWRVPIYVSLRTPSEQIAAMNEKVIQVMADHIGTLKPLVQILSGRVAGSVVKTSATKSKAKKSKAAAPQSSTISPHTAIAELAASIETFSYVSEIKPLHLRRGFINLTPEHWPFFATSARAVTCPVTVLAGGVRDKDSTVWRLQPTDMARLVLSPRLHNWLGDNYVAGDQIQLVATKSDGEIEIALTSA